MELDLQNIDIPKKTSSSDDFNPSDFTILIVDDLPKNIQVLGNVLKNQNYNIEFATDGLKALNWLERRMFDLILLDIMMPEMNGYETCDRIRNNEQLKDIPVIFLTARTDKESIVKGFEVGAHDYVSKPFHANELLARVKTQLELKQSKQKLRDINSWLEKKVEERTIELKHTNRLLKKTNKRLDIANKDLINLDIEKSEFLKIISHEIRTPLNGLLGILDILKTDIEDETILQYFKYIDVSSYRLEKFAIQALLITELKTKSRSIKKAPLSIKDIINNLIEKKFRSSIAEKNLNLLIDIHPQGIQINADLEMFTICIDNIIENAIEYSDMGKQIDIKTFNSEIGLSILISDQGSGFSEKALKNLYKLFAPGEDHIDKNMGLDLALVNLIMQAHSGYIRASNNLTGGATIELFFPQ